MSDQKVFELYYMRSIRLVLNSIGQWPNRALGDWSLRARMTAVYHIFLILTFSSTVTLMILYLMHHHATIKFIDLGRTYTNVFLTLLFLQRAVIPFQKNYKEIVKKFCLEFHLMHHEHLSEFAAKETRKVNRICLIALRVMYVQLTCGVLSYNLSPLFANYYAGMFSSPMPENKTFAHSVDYLLPFDAYTNLSGYIVLFFFNFFPSYNIPAAMCFYDLLLFMMVFHIVGHLNILAKNLKEFPKPKDREGVSKSEYNEEVFERLKNVIRHYQIIKEFMVEMSYTFDLKLCCYLAFHQVMCCLLLLECSTLEPEALVKFGMLTIVIFQQLIQTSVVFELIRTKSERLPDKVYSVPWEYMDVKNRRILLLFLRNVQDPLGLKAGGMVPVGVLTMSTIIRNSFSYYLILATRAKMDQ